MAGETAVQVEGLQEFRRELKRAGAEFPKQLRQANLEAAEVVAAEARRRAPRGPHEGKPAVVPVASSIRALASQRAGRVAVGGARSPHAPVLEFGGTIPRRGFKGVTRSQKAKGVRVTAAGERITGRKTVAGETRQSVSTTLVRAQPYLYPALAAKEDEVVDVYDAAIGHLIKRAFPG